MSKYFLVPFIEEKKMKRLEVLKSMKVMAMGVHGIDITPCTDKPWDHCLKTETIKGQKEYQLWYNTPDRSTHILRKKVSFFN